QASAGGPLAHLVLELLPAELGHHAFDPVDAADVDARVAHHQLFEGQADAVVAPFRLVGWRRGGDDLAGGVLRILAVIAVDLVSIDALGGESALNRFHIYHWTSPPKPSRDGKLTKAQFAFVTGPDQACC